ncbi:MAG TPA: sugar phosphate isomerase/epimerase [Acidimicrobiales bacterium]|nr:sugar phosphate isomerase/epimerase [Acidimicrobiales bacterium]
MSPARTGPAATGAACRLSVNPLTTPGWTLDQDLALCRTLGLTRTSISMDKLARAGPAEQVALRIAEADMRVDIVYPATLLDMTRPETWAEAQERLSAAVEVAASMGAGGLLLAGGAGHGLSWEEAASRFAVAVDTVAALGRQRGVKVLLEAVRPQFAYASFVHSFRDAVAVASDLDLGLVFDITHCWWEPQLDEILTQNIDRIGSVHIADLPLDRPATGRLVPGDGELPIGRLLSVLLGAGYTGPLELELIGPAIDAEGYQAATSRAVRYTREILERIES